MLISFRKIIFRTAALDSSLVVAICRVFRSVRVWFFFFACQLFVAGFAVCILQFKLSLKELCLYFTVVFLKVAVLCHLLLYCGKQCDLRRCS